MKLSRSNRIAFAVTLLTLTFAGATTRAAVVVNLPSDTLESNGVTRALNVSVAGGTGEAITGYDLFFSIAPRVGAVGTLTLSGDWATAPQSAAVFGAGNPVQNETYYAGYALTSGSATLSSTAFNLLAMQISAAPGTLGTFDLVVNGQDSILYADDELNPVPNVSFASGTITVVPAATAVPEPATAAFLGLLAGVSLLARARRA